MQWAQLVVSATSGVAVAVIIAFAQTALTRRQVPTGLSRPNGRRSYFSTMLKISRNSQVEHLEGLVPKPNPAIGVKILKGI